MSILDVDLQCVLDVADEDALAVVLSCERAELVVLEAGQLRGVLFDRFDVVRADRAADLLQLLRQDRVQLVHLQLRVILVPQQSAIKQLLFEVQLHLLRHLTLRFYLESQRLLAQ